MSRPTLAALPYASLVALAAEATRILDAAYPTRPRVPVALLPRAMLVERVRIARLVGARVTPAGC